MKNPFSKIVKIIIIGSILIIFVSVVFANDEGAEYKYNDNKAIIFKEGVIRPANSISDLSACTPCLDILYKKDGKLHLTLTMNNDFHNGNIDLSVVLYPSQTQMYKDKALLGKRENITTNFELICLWIENEATSWTLMEPNLYMEGHKIIMVGILNTSTDDVYYLQQVVDDLDFNQMLGDAKNNSMKENISDEELKDLESDYLMLRAGRRLIPSETVGGTITVKKTVAN